MAADRDPPPATLPALALVFNAFVWGVSWWPLRAFEAHGLHPLWTTAIVFVIALLAISIARPEVWRELLRQRSLWWLVAAAGTTNATFNWGVTVGDVVRVVLMFYLMPVWAVLLGRVLLGEAIRASALARIALALAGAALVLWPAHGGVPWPSSLGDWLGLVGGASYALNNVLLRREAARSAAARATAMFLGGLAVSLLLALGLTQAGRIVAPPSPAAGWIVAASALALVYLASNWALQYGAARLPAGTTAVIMLSEVLFASASAIALGAAGLEPRTIAGGLLIVAAAALAAFQRSAPKPETVAG